MKEMHDTQELAQKEPAKKIESELLPPMPEFMLRNRDSFVRDYKRILEQRMAGESKWKRKQKKR